MTHTERHAAFATVNGIARFFLAEGFSRSASLWAALTLVASFIDGSDNPIRDAVRARLDLITDEIREEAARAQHVWALKCAA